MYKFPFLTIYILQKRKGAIKIGITINEILIPKKLFGARLDKELELDTAIPDHCPDIARIIKVDCTPFSENCSVEDGKAVVRGRAVYDILYETDYKNRLRCCSFTQEFSHSLPIPRSDADGMSAFCSLRCTRLDCKLIGARRVVIRAMLGAQMDIEGDIAVKALAVEEDSETFFRKKTIGFDGRTALHRETFRFNDQLPLSRNEKSIGEIVCGSITVQPPQISLSPGAASLNTTATVRALCEEENNEGSYYMAVKTMPVNIEYSNDTIEDFKRISVSLEPTNAEFRPELDQYGESRIIGTDFSVAMTLRINEPKAYTVAEDVFEKRFDSEILKETAVMPRLISEASHGFTAEGKTLPLTPKPENLLDASAEDYGSAAETTENGIKISGSFIVTVLANTAEGVHSFDCPVPYEESFDIELDNGKNEVVADVFPIEAIPTLHSDGSISLRVVAEVKIYVYGESEETFAGQIGKRIPKSSSDDTAAMIYFYPQKGEELWSIAKLYRVDPESVSEANPNRFDERGCAIDRQPIMIKCR